MNPAADIGIIRLSLRVALFRRAYSIGPSLSSCQERTRKGSSSSFKIRTTTSSAGLYARRASTFCN